jgi:TolB-like protein/DNA-binding winged helix-turn-helix (wHTH) protein/Tfp pilus assembly protein PilF
MDAQVQGADGRLLRLGAGWFDSVSGELSLDGRSVRLRPRTAALLAHLARHAGRIVGKDELMLAVWPDVVVTDDSLVQCVKEIRHALGDGARDWIRTVPRQGYAFAQPLALATPAALPDAAPAPLLQPEPLPPRGRWRGPTQWLATAALLAAVVGLAWRIAVEAAAQPPSIVVMPIVNMSGDAARDFAAEDLTEQLASALARVPGLAVTAPSTAFSYKGRAFDAREVGQDLGVRYVLEGSLRAPDGEPKLLLRLVEAASARQLWSGDVSAAGGHEALASQVRNRVASSLSLRVAHVEAQRARPARAPDPVAAELLARARAMMRWAHRDVEARVRARPLLEQSLARDDSQAEAWALLAKTYLFNVRFSRQRGQDLQSAADAVARALALAPDSLEGHLVLAWVHYESRRMPEALAEAGHALELAPDMPIALGLRGAALVNLGRAQDAPAPLERAIRLSPNDPYLADWLTARGVAALHLGRVDEAVGWLDRAAQRQPETPGVRLFLAGALGAAGRAGEAQLQMAQFQRLRPGFSLSQLRAVEPSDDPTFLRQRERLYAGLRVAGMPE